jgi:hypothetical protein
MYFGNVNKFLQSERFEKVWRTLKTKLTEDKNGLTHTKHETKKIFIRQRLGFYKGFKVGHPDITDFSEIVKEKKWKNETLHSCARWIRIRFGREI